MSGKIRTLILIWILCITLIPSQQAQIPLDLEYELSLASIYDFHNDVNFAEPVSGTFSIKEAISDGIEYYEFKLFVKDYFDMTVMYKKIGEFMVLWGNSTEAYQLPFYLTPKSYIVGSSTKIEGNSSFYTTGQIASTDPTITRYYGFQRGVTVLTKDFATELTFEDGGTAYFRPDAFYDSDTGIMLTGFIFSFPIFLFMTKALISGYMHLKYSSLDIGPEDAKARNYATIGEFLPVLIPLFLAILAAVAYKVNRVMQRKKRRSQRIKKR